MKSSQSERGCGGAAPAFSAEPCHLVDSMPHSSSKMWALCSCHQESYAARAAPPPGDSHGHQSTVSRRNTRTALRAAVNFARPTLRAGSLHPRLSKRRLPSLSTTSTKIFQRITWHWSSPGRQSTVKRSGTSPRISERSTRFSASPTIGSNGWFTASGPRTVGPDPAETIRATARPSDRFPSL